MKLALNSSYQANIFCQAFLYGISFASQNSITFDFTSFKSE